MNINNIFAGMVGFILAIAMTYLFWTPMTGMLDGIAGDVYELGIFLKVLYVVFVFVVCIIIPINLSTTDDNGNN